MYQFGHIHHYHNQQNYPPDNSVRHPGHEGTFCQVITPTHHHGAPAPSFLQQNSFFNIQEKRRPLVRTTPHTRNCCTII